MLTDEELIEQAQEDIKTAWEDQSEWRVKARRAYKFESGKQWEENDEARLQELKRACFTFNRIKPMIKAVRGMEIGNRQEIKCTPRASENNGVSGVFDLLVKWARDEGGLAEEESDAWRDLLICGMGWTATAMDYSEGKDGKIFVERVSPLDMIWDTSARRQNLRDARFKGRILTMSAADFDRKFSKFGSENAFGTVFGVGGIDMENAGRPNGNRSEGSYSAANQTLTSANTESFGRKKQIVVAQYEYCTYEPKFYVANPLNPGPLEEYDAEKFAGIEDKLSAEGWVFYERGVSGPPEGNPKAIPYVKLDHKHWYRAFFTGSDLIENNVNPDPDNGTLHAMTGEREEETGYFFGVVENAEDPQMLLNKVISAMVDIFNFGGKDGLMAERGAFVNWDQAQRDYTRFDRMIELAPGGGDLIQKRTPGQMPATAPAIVDLAINGLPATTAINVETVGITGKDQPGILEQTRKQSTMAALSSFFDALRAYRIEAARTMLFFLRNYFDAATIAGICGSNTTPEAIQAMKASDVLSYKIVVGDAPNNPNQRDAVLKVTMDWVQFDPTMAAFLLPEMVPYLPLPEPLIQKLLAKLAQQGKPSPEQQQAQAADLQQKAATIQRTIGEAHAAEAKASAAAGGTEIKAKKVGLEELKNQLDFIATMVENKMKGTENA